MCGIAGAVALGQRATVDRERLTRMADLMSHRGPDGHGAWADPTGRAALVHRRLSIIDLAGGHQPMCSDDGRIALVLNGEIYNYRELRASLTSQGVRFRTVSDTEVLLRMYERDGVNCLQALRGMFAFAVWDANRGLLMLARDRVGKKPLFYAVDDGCVYFASTLAAVRDTARAQCGVSLAAVDAFLTLSYIPAPHSIWEGIHKLGAGELLTVRAGEVTTRRYWSIDPAPPRFAGTFTDAVDRLRELLAGAVALRLRSDVPLGLFLSGGIDSSLVTAIAAQQSGADAQTFSLGFAESGFDESGYAERIAAHLGTRHRTFRGRPEMLAMLPTLVRHFAEPFGDSSALAVWMLAREARAHVTVALTGDGGDEGFAGYEWYRTGLRLTRLRRWAPRAPAALGAALAGGGGGSRRPRWAGRVHRALRTLALDEPERFAALRTFVGVAESEMLYAGALRDERQRNADAVGAWVAGLYREGAGSALQRMRRVDIGTYLADCLLPKVDVATMAHGLEARSPLLDPHVLEFGLSLPDRWLINGNGGKPLLRALLARFFPAHLFERPKQGFSLPLAVWFGRGSVAAWADGLASGDSLADRGWFNAAGIRHMLDEHRAGHRDHSQRLYSLLVLREWLKQH